MGDHPRGSSAATRAVSGAIRVVPWDDPLVESLGFDLRSRYVERFWLPVLGPSATWLLRRIADRLASDPEGFDLPLEDTARALGLGGVGGRHSPFNRALARCARYRALRHAGTGVVAVRRRLAPVPAHLARRFPMTLADEHRRWSSDPSTARAAPRSQNRGGS